MKNSNWSLIVSVVVALSAGSAFAADPKPNDPTPEQRQKMAEVHEKMASCLRSDKPVQECHDEMRKSCQETMGKDGCPMMNGHGPGMGRGKHRS